MKKLMLFSMWLAASAAAVGVAWAGVSVVDNQVVHPPSAAEFAQPAASIPVESAPQDSQLVSEPGAEVPSTPLAEQADASTSTIVDQAPPATAAPVTIAPPSTATPPAPAIPPPPPAATTQTLSLVGGTASISYSSTGVQVLWATPNPGFEVDIDLETTSVEVEFESEQHVSIVEAWWSGGPQYSVSEEPQD